MAASASSESAGGRRRFGVAQDFIRTAARFVGLGDPEPQEPSVPATEARANSGEGCLLQVPFRAYRDEERYVGGLVLTPGDDNAFGDIWEVDDIRVSAYRFMEQSRHIDLMHTTKVLATPVESYYFPTPEEGGQEDYTIYGETVPAGSWWLGSRVQDDDAWELVKSGGLKGYSMLAIKLTKKRPAPTAPTRLQTDKPRTVGTLPPTNGTSRRCRWWTSPPSTKRPT